mmetsp:Transcript_14509/g.47662  ORF Transcript_14509/g.47662 Transcript_14509/m.47662 type:complete len:318 (+) Transcript_14509:391-1344(+)
MGSGSGTTPRRPGTSSRRAPRLFSPSKRCRRERMGLCTSGVSSRRKGRAASSTRGSTDCRPRRQRERRRRKGRGWRRRGLRGRRRRARRRRRRLLPRRVSRALPPPFPPWRCTGCQRCGRSRRASRAPAASTERARGTEPWAQRACSGSRSPARGGAEGTPRVWGGRSTRSRGRRGRAGAATRGRRCGPPRDRAQETCAGSCPRGPRRPPLPPKAPPLPLPLPLLLRLRQGRTRRRSTPRWLRHSRARSRWAAAPTAAQGSWRGCRGRASLTSPRRAGEESCPPPRAPRLGSKARTSAASRACRGRSGTARGANRRG